MFLHLLEVEAKALVTISIRMQCLDKIGGLHVFGIILFQATCTNAVAYL